MQVLITGGAGFIGSRLAHVLLRRGDSIIILDNFNNYYDPSLKRANIASLNGGAEVIEGDVRDTALVERVFKEHQIEGVAHMAAMAGVRLSAQQAHLYAEVNTLGTINLLEAAAQTGVGNFILSSTSSVYGNTKHIPFVESDSADRPLAPYPASKRAAEMFAYAQHHLSGLNTTILRFFNVYGPQGRPDMMPMRVIDSILRRKPITIYAGGALQRDWTYIDDIVSGVVAALDHPLGYEILNMGFGSPITLNTFLDIYEGLIGQGVIRQETPAPLTEPLITYCDNSRARQKIGFQPIVDVAEGLARTWEWYKTQPSLMP